MSDDVPFELVERCQPHLEWPSPGSTPHPAPGDLTPHRLECSIALIRPYWTRAKPDAKMIAARLAEAMAMVPEGERSWLEFGGLSGFEKDDPSADYYLRLAYLRDETEFELQSRLADFRREAAAREERAKEQKRAAIESAKRLLREAGETPWAGSDAW